MLTSPTPKEQTAVIKVKIYPNDENSRFLVLPNQQSMLVNMQQYYEWCLPSPPEGGLATHTHRLQGGSRSVWLWKRWAFKFPWTSFPRYGIRGWWYRLLHGLLCNLQEKEFSVMDYEPIPLAPLIFSCPAGWLNIMERGKPLTEDEWMILRENTAALKTLPLFIERKRSSFAWIKGKIHVVDYGG